MSQGLHCSALADELFHCVGIVFVDFEYLYSDFCSFPLSFVNDSIPTFGDFFYQFEFLEIYLQVLREGSWVDLLIKVIVDV